MKHVRHMTRSAEAAVSPVEAAVSPAEAAISPLQAKFDYIAGLVDAGIAFVMQKEGGAL